MNTSIIELLQGEGIRTDAQFATWCLANRLKGESRYQTLKRKFGRVNADRVLRVVEVASWKLVEVRKEQAAIRRTVRTVLFPVRIPSQKHIEARQRRKDMGYE